jgi:hypothetical protein
MPLTADRKTDKLDTDETVDARILKYPVEAATSIFGGGLVFINPAGNAVSGSAAISSAFKAVGRANRQCLNLAVGGTVSPDGIANGAAGSIMVPVQRGIFYLAINADSTITKANFGASVFASNDAEVSLSDAGGTRAFVGFIVDPAGDMAPSPLSSQVGVLVGYPNPYALNPELGNLATQYKARAVVTSLQAYTGSGTGTLTQTALAAGWQVQDGVTNAVGDIVFIQAGTTNLVAAFDSGPWQISVLGSASIKWVLVRPDWWTNASVMPLGAVLELDGEGTNYAGSSWKSFATQGAAVVGTNDPAFYIRQFVTAVTLVTGFVKLGASQTFPGLRSATLSDITFTPTNFNGAASTVSYRTGAYASGGSATAAGYMGTSTVSITALVAAGTFNTTDVGTGLLTIRNW